MKKKIYVALTVIVMTAYLTACQGFPSFGDDTSETDAEDGSLSDFSNEVSDAEDADEETEGTGTGESDEELEQELYNTYIEINNYMVGRLEESLNRYFEYVDAQEEFMLLDPDDGYYSCYSISEYTMQDLETACELIARKSAPSALDQAFLDMYPSLKELMLTLNDIYDYTDMESYLDDDYAKAKEYHAALYSALEEYASTGDAFMNELNIVAAERQEESLARMKDEGFEVFYTMNMVMLLAEEIEQELYSQGVWDDNILDMDLETIQPLYDEFVTYVETLLEYSKDKEKLAAEGLSSSGYFDSFIRDMKDAKTSLTKVLQKVKDGEALSDSDLLITSLAGYCSLSSFDTGLTGMINDYNRLVSY